MRAWSGSTGSEGGEAPLPTPTSTVRKIFAIS